MTDLSDQFAEQRSNIIQLDGSPTYGLFEFDEIPLHMELTFIAAKTSPVQGIRLRMTGGNLEVNGEQSSEVVLWEDTAPKVVNVDVRADDRARNTTLKLWNVWRGGMDVTQAWLGNAAIQVDGDPSSGSFRFRCSDGQGEPNFDDLVVQVHIL